MIYLGVCDVKDKGVINGYEMALDDDGDPIGVRCKPNVRVEEVLASHSRPDKIACDVIDGDNGTTFSTYGIFQTFVEVTSLYFLRKSKVSLLKRNICTIQIRFEPGNDGSNTEGGSISLRCDEVEWGVTGVYISTYTGYGGEDAKNAFQVTWRTKQCMSSRVSRRHAEPGGPRGEHSLGRRVQDQQPHLPVLRWPRHGGGRRRRRRQTADDHHPRALRRGHEREVRHRGEGGEVRKIPKVPFISVHIRPTPERIF